MATNTTLDTEQKILLIKPSRVYIWRSRLPSLQDRPGSVPIHIFLWTAVPVDVPRSWRLTCSDLAGAEIDGSFAWEAVEFFLVGHRGFGDVMSVGLWLRLLWLISAGVALLFFNVGDLLL